MDAMHRFRDYGGGVTPVTRCSVSRFAHFTSTRVARRPARRRVVVLLRTTAGAGRAHFNNQQHPQIRPSRAVTEPDAARARSAWALCGGWQKKPAPNCKIAACWGDNLLARQPRYEVRLRCVTAIRHLPPRLTAWPWGSSVPSLLPTWSRLASRPPGLMPFVGRPGCQRSPTLAQPGSPMSGSGGLQEREVTIRGLSRSPLGRPKRSHWHWWGPTCPSCRGGRPGTRDFFVQTCLEPRLRCSRGRTT